MPTGYTAYLQDHPDCTLAEFAWRCARNFGFCIMQRDDPTDAEVKLEEQPSDYNTKKLKELRAERDRISKLTEAEWDAVHKLESEAGRQRHDEYQAKAQAHVDSYERMLAMVNDWQPPAELIGMKKFMVSQITESIRFDGPSKPDEMAGRIYGFAPMTLLDKVEKINKDIAYHEKEQAEELHRVAERNRYKRLLLESVGEPSRAIPVAS